MTRYDSGSTETDGQYPTSAWHWFGLPEQNETSGAAGSSPPSNEEDTGGTNQPGQYPSKEDFTGVPLDGSGAPGTQGIKDIAGGSDSVAFSLTTFYKGQNTPGGTEQGMVTAVATGTVSGDGDWTQANDTGYNAPAQYQMPGVAGNTPTPGSGQYQTDGQNGSGHVLYGGYLKGSRPGSRRRTEGGPGT